MHIVPYYAAILALVYLFLSYRVITGRNTNKVTLGTGGNAAIERLVRVHANFAEYTPFALLLLMMAEFKAVAPLILHGLGSALILGRAVHAYGVSQTPENFRFRITGMMLTFGVLAVTAVALLVA